MSLLSLHDVRMKAGNIPLLEGISLHIEKGERICLLGRNGSGKSTLMKIVAGEIRPDSGEISATSGARVAYLAQEVPQGIGGRVFDVAAGGAGDDEAEEHLVNATLMNLGLDGEADFDTLSGGLKRRAMLARALVSEPDLLLLDEPTNHLDIDSINWLEERLMRYVRTLLFVTHDRAFLRRLSTRIVEIDRGKISSWDCGYDLYLERKAAALEAEVKQNQVFDRKLQEEEAWIRRGVKARTTRNEGRVRALKRMREERRERREIGGTVRMGAQDTGRSGHIVFEARDASFAYDGGVPIVRDLSTLVLRGDKVGIIGSNGSGKTTTLKLLLGEIQPQTGTVRQGTRLQIAYFDQLRAALDENATVQQNVAADNDTVLINGVRRHIVGYLGEFLFSSERARTKVSVLSGGERNRLLLAKLFTQPANLLVMDEPTNDLDAETLELLEDLLVNYEGTLLIVSHDRDFLNNVVTSTLAPLGDGRWREYIGGYDDWQRQRAAEKRLDSPALAGGKPRSGGEAAAKTARPERPAAVRKRRPSSRETQELQSLPSRIEALENEHASLVEKLADAAFLKSGAEAVKAARQHLAALEMEIATVFSRWEELEALCAETG